MRRFFIPADRVIAERALLKNGEFHHLRHVLRLGPNALIDLYDDRGASYEGTITSIGPDYAEICIIKTFAPEETRLALTLGQCLLKGSKMDLVVEKATELGVSTIAPIKSDRAVSVVPTEKQTGRLERWRRITIAAAKQSGNLPPEIMPLQSLREFLNSCPGESEKIVFSEQERETHIAKLADQKLRVASVHILIGPEGGFRQSELTEANQVGFQSVSLGPEVLRAETASISAVTACRLFWGPMSFPPLR